MANRSRSSSVAAFLKALIRLFFDVAFFWHMRLWAWWTRPSQKDIQLECLNSARYYEEWEAAAFALDELFGNDLWFENPSSKHYDYRLIHSRLQYILEAREDDDILGLVNLLRSGLVRNLGNITAPRLYNRAYAGTKLLIEDYITQVALAVEYVTAYPTSPMYDTSLTNQAKLDLLHDTRQALGRSVLVLQGGSIFGLCHIGVVKALHLRGLLPRIISGTATGALMAALVGVHNEDELLKFLSGEGIDLTAFATRSDQMAKNGNGGFTQYGWFSTWFRRAKRFVTEGYLLDSRVLEECVRANVGDLTFMEAYQRTKRVLNITVAPTGNGMPSLLNYLTAPNVLIWSAALASNASDVLYSPLTMKCKDESGNIVPWASIHPVNLRPSTPSGYAAERDSPLTRIAELFNVNHFIVSQARPYIAPFLRSDLHSPKPGYKGRSSLTASLMKVMVMEVQHRLHQLDSLGYLPAQIRRFLLDENIPGASLTLVPESAIQDSILLANISHVNRQDWKHWPSVDTSYAPCSSRESSEHSQPPRPPSPPLLDRAIDDPEQPTSIQTWRQVLKDWWVELLCLVFATASLCLVTIGLGLLNNKPLASWHLSISLNAVVSALIVATKAALIYATACCLGQLKWHHFQHSLHARSLYDLKTFDEASKGPLGAVKLIFRLRRVSLLAWFGGAIVVAAVFMEVFGQQVLGFVNKSVVVEGGMAGFPVTQHLSSQNSWYLDYTMMSELQELLLAAIFKGDATPGFECSTAECTWPASATLGICSQCVDVTETSTGACEGDSKNLDCSFEVPGFGTLGGTVQPGGPMPLINTTTMDGVYDATPSFYNFSTLVVAESTNWTAKLTTCELSWCTWTFDNATSKGTDLDLGTAKQHPLQFTGTWDKTNATLNLDDTQSVCTVLGDYPAGLNNTFTISQGKEYFLKYAVRLILKAGYQGADFYTQLTLATSSLDYTDTAAMSSNLAAFMTNALRTQDGMQSVASIMGYKSLKDTAKDNPSQLGDPVSLKAETSNTEPTEKDRPNKSGDGHKSLKDLAQENPTQLGDPVSLKAETSDTEPTENDRGASKAHPEKTGKPKL
ncbi:patatin-domain-containing protein, partial [Aureobasidium melanogenum]